MNRPKNPWRKDELEYLRQHYDGSNETNLRMAEALGRSVGAVNYKVFDLKLRAKTANG